MRHIKEFIGNEPDQVVEPDAKSGDKKDVPAKNKKTRDMNRVNPKKYVDTAPTLDEAPREGVAVISFGRMNPVTSGHEVLVNKVISTALKNGGTPLIYLSHSTDPKKNPLTYDQKINFAKSAFGKVIQKSKARTIIEVAKELQNKFSDLVVVVGSDRVKEFDTLLNKYNGKDYNYNSIEVVSAGERDPDADDVTGMSASKMRALAKDGDMESFKKGLPRKLQSKAKAVYDAVRDGMNINEEVENLDEALTRQQRLKRKMLMRRLAPRIAIGRRKAERRKASPEVLKKRAKRQVIQKLKQKFSRGQRYQDLDYGQRQKIDDRVAKIPQSRINMLMKRVLPKVKQAEKERIANKILNKASGSVSSPKKEEINRSFEQFLESRKTHLERAIELAEALGANPNYAIKEIEKVKKGISNHFLVKEALEKSRENISEESYQEYTIESRIDEGPTYHTGLSKSTADKRKAQFKKQSKMDDDNPAAYKPAPGDARAETKPSQHTKKFKDMFGESLSEVNYEKAFLKKPHMLLAKNGSVKIDKRFKINRKAKEVDMLMAQLNKESLEENLNDLAESVEFIFESNPKEAIKKKAEKTGISYGILKKVFDRGVAAWRTGHRPGTTPTQWGLARINSFATGGKTRTTADKDLWAKHKGSKND